MLDTINALIPTTWPVAIEVSYFYGYWPGSGFAMAVLGCRSLVLVVVIIIIIIIIMALTRVGRWSSCSF